ncbi:MAG: ABC transporter permease [Bacteroidales bacterium]|nr:ABC transporter permease [Bacteroidales bacterium]
MNISFYIAKKYTVSGKKSHIINVISWISVVGIAVGTMALVVVLSVFNGIEDLVFSMVNSFDPPLKVVPVEGKNFDKKTIDFEQLQRLSAVQQIVQVVEENALAAYDGQQYVVKVKGVSPNYQQFIPIDSMILDGQFILEQESYNYASLGAGVWYHLHVNVHHQMTPLVLIAPERNTSKILHSNSFTTQAIMPKSVFSVEQDYDQQYVLVPLRFAATLFQYDSLLSYLEIWCSDDTPVKDLKNEVQAIVGKEMKVLDRQQQQETLYKIMFSEKWAVFLILTFILIVASFNMISSMSIIIMDKRRDMFILHSMGNPLFKIRRIFLIQGFMQTFLGAVAGILFGLLLCVIQIYFGVVPLGGDGSSFVVTSYPVSIRWEDIVLVLMTTLLIGFFAALLPAFRINKKFLEDRN